MVNITTVDLFQLARSLPYATGLFNLANTNNETVNLLSYNDTFKNDIIGPDATVTLLSNQPYDAFHEAGVYSSATNASYISSNFGGLPYENNRINVTVYNFTDDSVSSIRYPNVAAANGATLMTSPACSSPETNGLQPNHQYVLWADEGDFEIPSGLVAVDSATGEDIQILTSFHGRNFSSANDVRQHPITGDIWFTDAQYGYFQDFRAEPVIPSQVYRFEPDTGVVQAVADGFEEANGIEFSPDLKTVYVTDTGAVMFDYNTTRPMSITAFDISEDGKGLVNRRLFATADSGVPDGIHTDTMGNVYASCGNGDGLHVWNPQGVLIGKFLVQPGDGAGTNNFEFIPGGILIFNGDRLWRVDNILAEGREVQKEWGTEAQR
ncbi:MAG: hypothetical protein Q9159_000413 [Coniocarpon cinnabarinum]